ncbi:hypothetical protein BRD00_02355 [Halobacteriales archaeon QS_8_69_26]|nr:MAG: hypothetical protein BRD00_02355 [Halobacteriales archaeon QS_8_69_26]
MTSENVQSEYRRTALDHRLDSGNRTEVVASRGDELLVRAREVDEEYRTAVERYRRGAITAAEFARRLAVLGWRADRLSNETARLLERADGIPRDELRAAGLNVTALSVAVDRVRRIRGAGTRALVGPFTGTGGNVSVGVDGGVSVAVEREDGGRARELERSPDGDDALRVERSTALSAAREALSDADGRWVVVTHATDARAGVYVFAFRLESNASAGTAVASVDGSSGEVVAVEEVTAPRAGGPRGACAERVASLRAEMQASVRAAGNASERAAVEAAFRDRIRTVREECADAAVDPGVNRSAALAAASGALPEVAGEWTLAGSYLGPGPDAAYVFEFRLSSSVRFGVATVRVDAADGSVLEVEEEVTTETATVNRSTALATAREALSDPSTGEWDLAGSTSTAATYEFVFRLSAPDAEGTAVVVVDAGSGEVLDAEETVTDLDPGDGGEENGTEDPDEGGINRSEAVRIALEVLSDPPEGSWTVTGAELADGVYDVEFVLDAEAADGTATVRVDAETGTVRSVEENVTSSGGEIGPDRALEVARAALPTVDGEWIHAGTDLADGTYGVAFDLDSQTANGSAVVEVDAENGTVLDVDANVSAGAGLDAGEAESVARSALPTVDGTWTLVDSEETDGVFGFSFVPEAENATGQAEIGVDGATGEVVYNETTVTGDDDTLDADEAESVARSALPSLDAEWTLEASTFEDGVYEFTFGIDTDDVTGQAELGIDADTGDVVYNDTTVDG